MSEQVASSILKFKQEDGTFLSVFPINTVDDVYYDIDKNLKLKDFLDNFAGYVPVENDDARFALTAGQVNNGTLVKVKNTDKLYLVVDETKLSTDDGYELIYTKNADGTGDGGPVNITTYTLDDMV